MSVTLEGKRVGKPKKAGGKPPRARVAGTVGVVYAEIEPALLEQADRLRQEKHWSRRVMVEEALRCLLARDADRPHGP